MLCTVVDGSTAARRALVISFSAIGRRALALASVVTMPSAANRLAARFAIMSRWWAAAPPKRRPFFGVAGISVLVAERQAALVELEDDLVERLLAEVRDGQQVVLGLLHELAHGVDLGTLEAVAGTLGQVEVFDGQVEVGGAGRGDGKLAQLEALRLVAHLGHQADERAERVAGRGQGVARDDRAVGLDVDDQAVVLGRLLDSGRLDLERHPAHRAALLSVASRRSPLRISTSDVSWMSAAVTSAGPRTSSRRVTGSSLCDTSTMSFRLRMTSVTSSTTPGMVSNSCRASSKRTCVMAAPGIDDSSVRRSELPRVWAKPGSRGPMANRCRLPSSSVTGSTVGRCMTSMTRGSFVRLRGVRATGDDVGAAGGHLL